MFPKHVKSYKQTEQKSQRSVRAWETLSNIRPSHCLEAPMSLKLYLSCASQKSFEAGQDACALHSHLCYLACSCSCSLKFP